MANRKPNFKGLLERIGEPAYKVGDKEYYTVTAFAAAAQVSEQTVKLWARMGKVPAPVSMFAKTVYTLDQVTTIMERGVKPAGTYRNIGKEEAKAYQAQGYNIPHHLTNGKKGK